MLLSCMHAYILLLFPIFPKSAHLCPQLLLFYVFSIDLPLINSTHLDDTSSAVMLPGVLNMTLCRETCEVGLLYADLRIPSKTYTDNARVDLKK